MSAFQSAPADGDNDWTKDDSDESVTGEEVNDESEEDDDDEGDEESHAVEMSTSASSTGKSSKGKVKEVPLSKKEKAAIKAKEMAELDNVFAEFGIDAHASSTGKESAASGKDMKGETDAASPSESGDKKKKKKKKKTTAQKPVASESPSAPLTKDEIKARLAAKAASAGKVAKPKVSIAVSAALKGGGDGKVQSKSEIKKAKALDWER